MYQFFLKARIMEDNAVLQAIHHRRSTRFFAKDRMVEKEKLDAIMEAGLWAPNGMGYQDPIFVSVEDETLTEQLRSLNAQIRGTKADPYYGAKTFVFVFGKKSWMHHVEDCSLAIGTMMLAADSLGVGSCWIDCATQVFELAEGRALKEKFGIPQDYECVGSMALGYAIRETKPRQRKDNRIRKF